jgi:hypothetical protein
MTKVNKIRSEEVKKLLSTNADLKALNDKVREARDKLNAYVKQQNENDPKATDAK